MNVNSDFSTTGASRKFVFGKALQIIIVRTGFSNSLDIDAPGDIKYPGIRVLVRMAFPSYPCPLTGDFSESHHAVWSFVFGGQPLSNSLLKGLRIVSHEFNDDGGVWGGCCFDLLPISANSAPYSQILTAANAIYDYFHGQIDAITEYIGWARMEDIRASKARNRIFLLKAVLGDGRCKTISAKEPDGSEKWRRMPGIIREKTYTRPVYWD